MYYFVYRNISTGGAELLINRMAKELAISGIRVSIMYENISEKMLELFAISNIRLVKISNWNKLRKRLETLDSSLERKIIITMFLGDFCQCYSAKIKNKKTILYSTHFLSLCPTFDTEGNEKKGFAYKFLKFFTSKIVYNFVKSGNFIVQDEQSVQTTCSYYRSSFELNKEDFHVLRISVDTDSSFCLLDNKIYEKYKKPKILTIARADFPFKGYMMGLCDWFSENFYNIKDLQLEIISYGKDIEILNNKIKSYPDDIRQRIQIRGETKYSDLNNLIDDSLIYVGMGTTLLDASKRGLFSFPVKSYTYNLTVYKPLYEDYRYVADNYGNEINFTNYVISIINDSCKNRIEKIKENIAIVYNHYSTKLNTAKLRNYIDMIYLFDCESPFYLRLKTYFLSLFFEARLQ